MRSEIPLLHDQIEEGQQYSAQSGPARGIYRQGAVTPRTFRHNDGSLIASGSDALEHFERILIKDGHTPDFVQAALKKSAAAPEMQTVELSPGVSIINWPSDNAKPDFSRGIPVDDLLVVKIAFEFFALLSGTAICNDNAHLNEVRHALNCAQPSAAFTVERLEAKDMPRHALKGMTFRLTMPRSTAAALKGMTRTLRFKCGYSVSWLIGFTFITCLWTDRKSFIRTT